ncbi:hypothetical protein [Noviluteimonas gilva]|uniref:Uncharacterized protein n=1 Tax=Noviluteimonas gilva TaxID=2682097 RepID=A0A7C9LWF4_9GAMM|nr:hypothetical protein [Lysobacter gilvus]MUV13545.1 hypothetical protein [Lysobacter gilvus]
MVDSTDFSSRLDAALAMNGLTNVTFAGLLGPNGQQLVYQWRSRGKIGAPSIPRVRSLLPRTNIDWLQEGHGPAERVSTDLNHPQPNGPKGSRIARLDVHMLSQALGVLEALEFKLKPEKLRVLDAATRLRDFYERLSAGEMMADLIAQIFNDDEQGKYHAHEPGDVGGTSAGS